MTKNFTQSILETFTQLTQFSFDFKETKFNKKIGEN